MCYACLLDRPVSIIHSIMGLLTYLILYFPDIAYPYINLLSLVLNFKIKAYQQGRKFALSLGGVQLQFFFAFFHYVM